MSLTITERQVGDVTIVEVAGRITGPDPGEARGTSDDFRDLMVRLLSAGKTRILLNTAHLKYVDSSGLAELVGAFERVTLAGGCLKLMGMKGGFLDLLRITLLSTVMGCYDDEQVAVRSFSTEAPMTARRCDCPVCRTGMGPTSVDGVSWQVQNCPSCRARVQVGEGTASGSAVQVLEIDVPTREGECFHVTCDRPVTVSVVGRLDLFSSSTLVQLWSAIPSPKRVLFHLDERVEISAPGWTKLMELVSRADGVDRATVFLDSIDRLPEELRRGLVLVEPGLYRWKEAGLLRRRFAEEGCVYVARTTAVMALGALGEEGPWMARVSPAWGT